MAGVRSHTTSILSRLKGFAGKVARRVVVEEKYFPPRSHRFTAVYSRDKEYLWVNCSPEVEALVIEIHLSFN